MNEAISSLLDEIDKPECAAWMVESHQTQRHLGKLSETVLDIGTACNSSPA